MSTFTKPKLVTLANYLPSGTFSGGGGPDEEQMKLDLAISPTPSNPPAPPLVPTRPKVRPGSSKRGGGGGSKTLVAGAPSSSVPSPLQHQYIDAVLRESSVRAVRLHPGRGSVGREPYTLDQVIANNTSKQRKQSLALVEPHDNHEQFSEERQHLLRMFRFLNGAPLAKLSLEPPPPRRSKSPKSSSTSTFHHHQEDFYHLLDPSAQTSNYAQSKATPKFENVSPKVDTGLNRLKQGGNVGVNGVPIVETANLHPLTLKSQLSPSILNYESYKMKREARIDLARKPTTTTQQLGINVRKEIANFIGRNNNGGGQNGLQTVELLRAPPPDGVPIDSKSTFPVGSTKTKQNKMRRARNHSPRLQRLVGRRSNVFNRTPTGLFPRLGLRQLGVRPNSFPTAHNHQQQQQGKGQMFRPSQLLPLHIPGPKHDNIYIGTYSGSDSDKESELGEKQPPVPPLKKLLKTKNKGAKRENETTQD